MLGRLCFCLLSHTHFNLFYDFFLCYVENFGGGGHNCAEKSVRGRFNYNSFIIIFLLLRYFHNLWGKYI